MDVQTASVQDYEQPCSRSLQVMPFTAAKMSRYADIVPSLGCSSTDTMTPGGSSTDVK